MGISQHTLLLIFGVVALSEAVMYPAEPGFMICPPPRPPCKGTIPLEQFQLHEIQEATSKLESFRGNRDLTYNNKEPIVTRYTLQQKKLMLQMFGSFFETTRPEPTCCDIYQPVQLWSVQNTGVPIGVPHVAHSQYETDQRRKRGNSIRVCPAEVVDNILVTAYDEHGNLIQIVQILGKPQYIKREVCLESLSPHVAGVRCAVTVHNTYVLAIHLQGGNVGKIQVVRAQVQTCTSVI